MKQEKERLIKFIETDQRKHSTVLVLFLVIFNIFLFLALLFLSIHVANLAVAIVEIVIVGLIWWWSIVTYNKARKGYKYMLFNTKIKMKSYRYNIEIRLEDIFYVESKSTFFDKLLKNDTSSLILHIKNNNINKLVMPFIKEDVIELSQDIMFLSNCVRQKGVDVEVKSVDKSKNFKENLNKNGV